MGGKSLPKNCYKWKMESTTHRHRDQILSLAQILNLVAGTFCSNHTKKGKYKPLKRDDVDNMSLDLPLPKMKTIVFKSLYQNPSFTSLAPSCDLQ